MDTERQAEAALDSGIEKAIVGELAMQKAMALKCLAILQGQARGQRLKAEGKGRARASAALQQFEELLRNYQKAEETKLDGLRKMLPKRWAKIIPLV